MEARSWTQPLGPTLGEPDPFLHLRLRHRDAWRDTRGEWLTIADASTVELWSILGYLRWYAPALLRRDPEAGRFADADAYLTSRPLVSAVDAELASRAGIESGTALECLRAAGVAPWELPVARRRSRSPRR